MSKQINKEATFLLRLDKGWRKILSSIRNETGWPYRHIVESALADAYGDIENKNKSREKIGKKDGWE